jgi:glutamine amidotransferase
VIALVDYGAGNLTSVRKALSALKAEFVTSRTADEVLVAHGIIVPGVGHFGATRAIDADLRSAIQVAVHRGAALLGICLGMQWLFQGSTEAPGVPGLRILDGVCGRLPEEGTQKCEIVGTDEAGSTQNPEIDPTPLWKTPLWKIPHVGWNSLEQPRPSALLQGVPQGAQVYFTHSYVAPVTPDTVATTTYASTFASAVECGRIAGVQFHPEKSGDVGLRILRNWLNAL